MKTVQYAGAADDAWKQTRSHPWTDAAGSSAHRYYDLKTTPSLIRTSLEDFVPWAHYAAIGDFYSLLEWMNAPSSPFESNDCAFTAPHANEVLSFDKALQCSGRVMMLHRVLEKNCAQNGIERLENELHRLLSLFDPTFLWGVVGTTICPVRYVALPANHQLGQQLMISFWAWGNTEAELMKNFARLLQNLSLVLHQLSNLSNALR